VANKTSVKLDLKSLDKFESKPVAMKVEEIKKANETKKVNETKKANETTKSNETITKPVSKATNATTIQKPLTNVKLAQKSENMSR